MSDGLYSNLEEDQGLRSIRRPAWFAICCHLIVRALPFESSRYNINRAKLEMTLTMLDDMGELSRLVRELIQSVTLYRDGEGGDGHEGRELAGALPAKHGRDFQSR